MTINYRLARKHLEAFDFKKLFVEVLGWGHGTGKPSTLTLDGAGYRLTPIAELGGMAVLQCEPQAGEGQPPMPVRRKVERQVSQTAFEHILIFTDRAHTRATWQWVKRGIGSSRLREHTYTCGQPGDALLQKLAGIAFALEELDDDGRVAIGVVTGKVTKSFDVEKVTKKFYDEFKDQHADFMRFICGIPVDDDRAWYVSVMLNRLMFIYFIQKKSFLDGDPDYLQHKLEASKARGRDRFYCEFLRTLFFEGLAHEPGERSPETDRLLGRIPYLNGGIFLPHDLERRYGAAIAIPDAVFERVFAFFDKYTWHLDERPWRADNEINPDVLGYIFEKYINQKQMGAYYTKEDITGYICRNTILPFLLDKLGEMRYAAMHPLPLRDIEPYIYPAVKQAEYLPTETAREYAARQGRLAGIRADFAAGKIAAVNDLITTNLDSEAFVQDWLAELDDPLTLRAFYFECLKKLTVLDPTCGSGAFLFAAMNILEPLYETCLDRMAEFAGPKYPDFTTELARVAKHPNRAYFVFKSIIVHNLYGVDIMEEAVEICKLRLFLKLVAQVEDAGRIEPLPDIDFNIRAGNTLVGYATKEEVAAAGSRSLFNLDLEERIAEATRGLDAFRDLQTRLDTPPGVMATAKQGVRAQLRGLEGVLDEALANEYSMDVKPFVASHQPFHWYVQFNGIMREGGFDVIVGNPPYVEYGKVKSQYRISGYKTESCGNLYAYMMERCLGLQPAGGRCGVIVLIGSLSTERMSSLQQLYASKCRCLLLSTYSGHTCPGVLFEGVANRYAIWLAEIGRDLVSVYTTCYQKWYATERNTLFAELSYHKSEPFKNGTCSKIGSALEAGIYSKLHQKTGRLSSSLVGSQNLWLYTTPIHWVKAFTFQPYFRGSAGQSVSTQLKTVAVSAPARNAAICLLNSSLFFWWWIVRSDCYHLTAREIDEFPVDMRTLLQTSQARADQLATALMEDLKRKSTIGTRNQRTTGLVEFQVIDPKCSKPIIDEIDRVLAQHYGFTDEELDFIINYDIKYRMGKELSVGEE